MPLFYFLPSPLSSHPIFIFMVPSPPSPSTTPPTPNHTQLQFLKLMAWTRDVTLHATLYTTLTWNCMAAVQVYTCNCRFTHPIIFAGLHIQLQVYTSNCRLVHPVAGLHIQLLVYTSNGRFTHPSAGLHIQLRVCTFNFRETIWSTVTFILKENTTTLATCFQMTHHYMYMKTSAY